MTSVSATRQASHSARQASAVSAAAAQWSLSSKFLKNFPSAQQPAFTDLPELGNDEHDGQLTSQQSGCARFVRFTFNQFNCTTLEGKADRVACTLKKRITSARTAELILSPCNVRGAVDAFASHQSGLEHRYSTRVTSRHHEAIFVVFVVFQPLFDCSCSSSSWDRSSRELAAWNSRQHGDTARTGFERRDVV